MRYQTDPLIHVDFVDAASGEVFAYTEMPSSQLPERFGPGATMNIGGSPWTVVEAEPNDSLEFRRLGRLRLQLRKPTQADVDPNAVVYSMPTIENTIPGIDPSIALADKTFLHITEDDWRQIEFIGPRWEFRINSELDAVRAIHRDHRCGSGYTSLHMRGSLPEPLDGTMVTVDELIQTVGAGVRKYDGLAYAGNAGAIYAGYAMLSRAGLCIYGTTDGGIVNALGLYDPASAGSDPASGGVWREVQALSDFMRRKKLILVDWCQAVKMLPGTPDLFEYFGL